MTAVVASQVLNGSLDTAIAGASLNSLANNGYALGPAINNTPTTGSVYSYDLSDLTLELASAVTTGTAPVNVIVFVLPETDGTNYPNPPGSTAGAASAYLSYTFQLLPSTAYTVIPLPNIPIPPYNFKFQIQQNMGATWPASGNTLTAQRKTIGFW